MEHTEQEKMHKDFVAEMKKNEIKPSDKIVGLFQRCSEYEQGRDKSRWCPDRLKFLLEKADIKMIDLANAINISEVVLSGYMKKGKPGLDGAIKIADFFRVPVDFLFGRCSEREDKEIFENFAEYFSVLRSAAYTVYLVDQYVTDYTVKRMEYELQEQKRVIDEREAELAEREAAIAKREVELECKESQIMEKEKNYDLLAGSKVDIQDGSMSIRSDANEKRYVNIKIQL